MIVQNVLFDSNPFKPLIPDPFQCSTVKKDIVYVLDIPETFCDDDEHRTSEQCHLPDPVLDHLSLYSKQQESYLRKTGLVVPSDYDPIKWNLNK